MVESQNNPSKVDNTTSDRSGLDITGEVEVDATDVKIFSIEALVPSSSPITIPYMEVYRTNELEYVPYISPYNVGASSSDSDSDSSSSDSNTDTNTDSNSDNSDTKSDENSNNDSNSDDENSSSNSSSNP